MINTQNNRRLPLLQRLVPVLGLFFLAPLTAEYLIGYLDITGNFPALLSGLVVLAPLYGGPALLIREVTRRTGRGWPTILLLASAFGLLQAGLVDHSLFNRSFQGMEWWDDTFAPTCIPLLGISANHTLNFIPGHIIWSIGIPIALMEALVPKQRATPWLGYPGLTITAILYIVASVLIFQDMMQQEQFLPTGVQFMGTGTIIVGLIVAAFLVKRPARQVHNRRAPQPWVVGIITFTFLNTLTFIEVALEVSGASTRFVSDWSGTTLYFLLLTSLALLVWRWSQSRDWRCIHVVALAAGALLTRAWLAFLVEPGPGPVELVDKLIHNLLFALGVIALLWIAAQRSNAIETNG